MNFVKIYKFRLQQQQTDDLFIENNNGDDGNKEEGQNFEETVKYLINYNGFIKLGYYCSWRISRKKRRLSYPPYASLGIGLNFGWDLINNNNSHFLKKI